MSLHRNMAIGLLCFSVIVPFGSARADLIIEDFSTDTEKPIPAPLPPRGRGRVSADQIDAAFARMRNRVGEVPAHIWVARNLLTRRVALPRAEALGLAESHLSSALQAKPDDVRAAQLMAQVYRTTDRLAEAIALLEPIAANGPAIRLQLTAISLEAELGEGATEQAKKLAADYRLRQEDGDEIGPREYQRWVSALLVLGNSDDAFSAVEHGLSAHPDDAELRRSFVDHGQIRFDQLARRGRATAQDRLKIIEQVMKVAPEDPGILQRVAALSATDGEVGRRCEELLGPYVASDEMSDAVRLAVARAKLRQEDYRAARHHYQRLYESDPTAGGVLITLAQLLAMTEPVDLPAALSMANKAIEQNPENIRFRQNRGQVLLRLERWMEAIQDLEMAVNGMPNRGDVHKSLAFAYEKAGKSQLAEVHRQQAERLEKTGIEQRANPSGAAASQPGGKEPTEN